MTRQRIWCVIAAVAALLGGCTSPESPAADAGRLTPTPTVHATSELTGHGLVLQKETEMPVLCLGPIAASRPPQCGGPLIRNWDWDKAGHYETASAVKWGAYEVTGTLDNAEFTQTRSPVPQFPTAAPTADVGPGTPGTGKEAQLLQLQKELTSLRGLPILKSWTERGYLFIDVVYDDGSIQRELDGKYGPNVIVIRSALKPVT